MRYSFEILLIEVRMGLRYAAAALSATNSMEFRLNVEHARAAYDAALKLRYDTHLTPAQRDTFTNEFRNLRFALLRIGEDISS
jgi:hypothetical protein